MRTNEGRVYFSLDGDNFDPDEITELLDLAPTSIRRKGSKIIGKVPKINSWELSTEKVIDDFIDVFEMSGKIINILRPKMELILEAKKRFNAEPRFQVVLTLSMNEEHSTPAIGFEIETIEFLGAIGAFVDIDTYKH